MKSDSVRYVCLFSLALLLFSAPAGAQQLSSPQRGKVSQTARYAVTVPCNTLTQSQFQSQPQEQKKSGFLKKLGKIGITIAIIGGASYAGERLADRIDSVPLKIMVIGGAAIAGERVASKLFEEDKPVQCVRISSDFIL